VTGDPTWDGVASPAIAVLPAGVAFGLGHQTYELLIGQAAEPEECRTIDEVLRRHAGVVDVGDLFTMVAPAQLLVAAHIDVDDRCSGDDVERLTGELEQDLRRDGPYVFRVFLDPTPRERARRERLAVGSRSGRRRARLREAGPRARDERLRAAGRHGEMGRDRLVRRAAHLV
jgi:divalent metal cation (Fe/Co/Zn/Cd) transporter